MQSRTGTRSGSEASKRRILDATLELARERGYEGTTIALVTKRSGLPSGSVYWHFQNKDSLMLALVDDSFARWKLRHFGDGTDPTSASSVASVFSDSLREDDESQGFWRLGLLLALERRMSDSLARRRFLEIREEMVGMLATRWAQELDDRIIEHDPTTPERIARFSLAVADGYFLAITAGEPLDPAECAHLIDDALHAYVERLTAATATEA